MLDSQLNLHCLFQALNQDQNTKQKIRVRCTLNARKCLKLVEILGQPISYHLCQIFCHFDFFLCFSHGTI